MGTAIIAGASGLVGSILLQILLDSADYQEVISISRKTLPVQNHKLKQLIIDFEKLCEHSAAIKGDVLFCCLGTTKSQSPDPAEYRKIELLYPAQLANLAVQNGAKQVHYISSIGADSNWSNFYLKLKGETESELTHMQIPSLHIYQPSLITGTRKQNRPTEKLVTSIMKLADPLLFGGLKKYHSIAAKTIAAAIYKQSLNKEPGIFIHPSDHIQQLA